LTISIHTRVGTYICTAKSVSFCRFIGGNFEIKIDLLSEIISILDLLQLWNSKADVTKVSYTVLVYYDEEN